jgi:DNA-binding NtrC family response regulator
MPGNGQCRRGSLADDQQHILEAIELLLRPQGYLVDTARSPSLARQAVLTETYDALLIDLNYTRDTTSGREGLDVLEKLQRFDPTLPVIVMTAFGSIDSAVECSSTIARVPSRSPVPSK